MATLSTINNLYLMFNDVMIEVTDRLTFPCKYAGVFSKCRSSLPDTVLRSLSDLKKAVIEYRSFKKPVGYAVTTSWVGPWDTIVEHINVDGYTGSRNVITWLNYAMDGLAALRDSIIGYKDDYPRLARLGEIQIKSDRANQHYAFINAFLKNARTYVDGNGHKADMYTLVRNKAPEVLRERFNNAEAGMPYASAKMRLNSLTRRGGNRRSKYTVKRRRQTRGLRHPYKK